jgi:hypothetical protein
MAIVGVCSTILTVDTIFSNFAWLARVSPLNGNFPGPGPLFIICGPCLAGPGCHFPCGSARLGHRKLWDTAGYFNVKPPSRRQGTDVFGSNTQGGSFHDPQVENDTLGQFVDCTSHQTKLACCPNLQKEVSLTLFSHTSDTYVTLLHTISLVWFKTHNEIVPLEIYILLHVFVLVSLFLFSYSYDY